VCVKKRERARERESERARERERKRERDRQRKKEIEKGLPGPLYRELHLDAVALEELSPLLLCLHVALSFEDGRERECVLVL
jgi:hypothetical protein